MDVWVGQFDERLSSRKPTAGVLRCKAVTLALSVLLMMKPGPVFHAVLALPRLRGTGLSVAKFPGVRGLLDLRLGWSSRGLGRCIDAAFSSWGCGYRDVGLELTFMSGSGLGCRSL